MLNNVLLIILQIFFAGIQYTARSFDLKHPRWNEKATISTIANVTAGDGR